MNPHDFKAFRDLIHQETGIWLRDGKQAMLAARLARRIRDLTMTDFAAYLVYVQQVRDGGDELSQLINCITTNKTSFFREKHHFDFLGRTLVPEAQALVIRGGRRELRVWSAACSTGEEPYTIAISLLDALESGSTANTSSTHGRTAPPTSGGNWRIEVVASDIDTKVLATAARAVYADEATECIPTAMLARYFLRGREDMSGRVRVKKQVTDLVRFERLNLMDTRWPPLSGLDAIFFRNALIYFNRDVQELFLRRMLRCLRPGGYLFLGHSEHVPWLYDAVTPLNHTIYQLRSSPQQGRPTVSPAGSESNRATK